MTKIDPPQLRMAASLLKQVEALGFRVAYVAACLAGLRVLLEIPDAGSEMLLDLPSTLGVGLLLVEGTRWAIRRKSRVLFFVTVSMSMLHSLLACVSWSLLLLLEPRSWHPTRVTSFKSIAVVLVVWSAVNFACALLVFLIATVRQVYYQPEAPHG